MPTPKSSLSIAERIQSLLQERQHHEDAITSIDGTLARVGAALIANGQAPQPSVPAAKAVNPAKAGKPKGKRSRRTFAITGEQLIVDFVRSHTNPMGREIEEHWKSEGRSGAAATTLTKLVKDDKLKRVPLKDQRGSRYSFA